MNTDIPSWAVRGSKVICLERDRWSAMRQRVEDPHGLMSYPEFALVYTLREVRVRFVPEWNEVMVGVLLEEVENPVATGGSATGEEPAWDIRGFAPIVMDRKRAARKVAVPA